jgi:hypothetical protein
VKLRKLVIATHRDIGYFFAGLTVLYAVSGVAVNHIEDEVLRRMGIGEEPRSVVRMSQQQLKVFLERRSLTVELPGGRVVDEHVRRRFAFFEVNYLHLNTGKGFWTWFADIYAVGLLVLACTGIFILPGKKGLGGRGGWLLIAGLAIPIVYLIIVVWL